MDDIRVVAMDTETAGMAGGIRLCGWMDIDQSVPTLGAIEEFMKDVTSSSVRTIVYAHNMAGFDLAKILQAIPTLQVDFTRSLLINGKLVVTFFKGYQNLEFRDSFYIARQSLSSLSKAFELEDSGKMDLSDIIGEGKQYPNKEVYFRTVPIDDSRYREYLSRDVIALARIIQKMYELYHFDDLMEFWRHPTNSSLAMAMFRKDFPAQYSLVTKGYLSEDMQMLIRKAYHAGRTEKFKDKIDYGYHYDVNSEYPSVMEAYEMPVGDAIFIDDEERIKSHWQWKLNNGEYSFLGTIHANVTVPKEGNLIPPLPTRINGRTMYITGTFEDDWDIDELVFAVKECGVIVNRIDYIIRFMDRKNLFKPFIAKWKQIKMTNTGALRQIAKDIQNSLSGKFAQVPYQVIYAPLPEDEKLKKFQYNHPEAEKCTLYGQNLYRYITYINWKRQPAIQPQISVHIVALARVKYMTKILRENAESHAYCDTDSVVTTKKLPDSYTDDKEYGKWKLERMIKKAVFVSPKLYAEVDENGEEILKSKGIIRSAIEGEVNYDAYVRWQKLLKDGKNVSLYKNYQQLQNVVQSLIKEGKPHIMVEVSKTLKANTLPKRYFFPNGDSRPWDAAELDIKKTMKPIERIYADRQRIKALKERRSELKKVIRERFKGIADDTLYDIYRKNGITWKELPEEFSREEIEFLFKKRYGE